MDTKSGHRDLDTLGQSPYPRFGLRAAVLENFAALKQARGMLWPWTEIAQALGLPPSQGRKLGVVYRRVEKQLAAGKVKLPQKPRIRQNSIADTAKHSNSVGNKGFINLDEV